MHLEWRKEIAAGSLLGPRLVVGGPLVDGPKPIWEGSIAIADAVQARQAVRNLKNDGYDFVKVYNLLPRDAYFAILDEAKKQGLPVVGHVPFLVSAREASNAGQKSMEHLYAVLEGCSNKQAEIAEEFRKLAADPEAAKDFALRRRREEMALDSYDSTQAAALFKRFVANSTWQSPTLTILRAAANLDDPNFVADPRLKYMPPDIKKSWDPKNDFRLKNLTKEDYAFRRQLFKKQLELVATMHRAGVEFLAGTDTLNPYCFAGFSLHDELDLLVKAGLSPMEALQAATRNPAKFLETLKDEGTIGEGKFADLVLLDADPLKDIKNTQQIAGVVVRGQWLPKKTLQRMLADVEAAANAKVPE
jgi:imidazolonepropionase-like amidohydrolase